MEQIQRLLTGTGSTTGTAITDGLKLYCPQIPHPKQQLFLELDCVEAFYGGAAAGGKSSTLLMAALQYVHVPGYSALILRKDETRLKMPGGLIPRSHEWLTGKADWDGKVWTFDTGPGKRPATITFGYCSHAQDKYRYNSSEFQYIAWDELSEIEEDDYLFLFSRLRGTEDIKVPLRVRSASNPGGKGHAWVKARFVGNDAAADLKKANPKDIYWREVKGGVEENDIQDAAFMPARIKDNPTMNEEKYRRSLSYMRANDRERMMNGDWTILEGARLKEEWLRDFTMQGEIIRLHGASGDIFAHFHQNECRRFVTVDTAGSTKQVDQEAKGKQKSWTVAAVWDYKNLGTMHALILRDLWREQKNFVEVCEALRAIHREWRPDKTVIEDATMGPFIYDLMYREFPIELIGTKGKGKIERATMFENMLSRGEVFLPKFANSWRHRLEAEWLSWQGKEDETNDQVDVAAYAAMEACNNGGGTTVVDWDIRGGVGGLVGMR